MASFQSIEIKMAVSSITRRSGFSEIYFKSNLKLVHKDVYSVLQPFYLTGSLAVYMLCINYTLKLINSKSNTKMKNSISLTFLLNLSVCVNRIWISNSFKKWRRKLICNYIIVNSKVFYILLLMVFLFFIRRKLPFFVEVPMIWMIVIVMPLIVEM